MSLPVCLHLDSGKDDDDYNDDDEDESGDVDEGGDSAGDEETHPAANSEDVVVDFSTSVCEVTYGRCKRSFLHYSETVIIVQLYYIH